MGEQREWREVGKQICIDSSQARTVREQKMTDEVSASKQSFWDRLETKLEAPERVRGYAKVKGDFYRTWTPAAPPAPPTPKQSEEPAQDGEQNNTSQDTDEDAVNGKKRGKKYKSMASYKKQKLEEKRKRGHMARPSWDNICGYAARSEPCPFQSGNKKCQYSHDTVEYVKAKPLQKGAACPTFAKHQYCPSGIRCLFGEEHTVIENDVDEGKEIARSIDKRSKDEIPSAEAGHGRNSGYSDIDECNYLRTDLLRELRKKKYNYGGQGEAEARPRRTAQDFANKIYIAPLTTVGNLPFRRITKDLGADITCGEMALAKEAVSGLSSEWALFRRHKCEDFFGVQIAGGMPKLMKQVVTLLDRETDVDFVDVNLGCPIDLVTDQGAGSALMTRVTKLRSIVEDMTSATQGRMPIGLKMRAGWAKGKFTAASLVSEIQGWRHIMPHGSSVCYVAVHGRSRQARYTSTADWDYIHQVAGRPIASEAVFRKSRFVGAKPLNPVPVFGNGDILSYTDWEEHMGRVSDWRDQIDEVLTDCQDPNSRMHILFNEGKISENGPGLSKLESTDETDDAITADLDALQARLTTCMVGRGALIKPWLSTEIKEKRHWDISGSERMDLLKNYVDYGLEHWGSDLNGVNKTRRFLLEWLSFTCRYVPVGLLDPLYVPQHINDRPPCFIGRDDKETILGSTSVKDWIKISEMFLGPAPEGFRFEPKHKSNSYSASVEERGDIGTSVASPAPSLQGAIITD